MGQFCHSYAIKNAPDEQGAVKNQKLFVPKRIKGDKKQKRPDRKGAGGKMPNKTFRFDLFKKIRAENLRYGKIPMEI
jgi:hypothetical protein